MSALSRSPRCWPFATGYTALVFVAGAFGGGLVLTLRLAAPRAAAAALMIATGLALASGAAWLA